MSAWHDSVVELIGNYQGTLEHMENIDCLTIVSIRLKRKTGRYLGLGESKKVFEWMTQDMSRTLDNTDPRPQ